MKRVAFKHVLLLAIACAAVSGRHVARADESATRTLSLQECVATALRQNPDVIASKYEVAAASAERSGARGEFGPRLRVEGNVTQWNSPFEVGFGAEPFHVRDSFTWGTTVSLIQPLSALFAIYDNYKLQSLGLDVASIHQEAARRDVIYRVHEAYYRALQAARVSDVAHASVTQLEAQLKQANVLHDNGVTDRSDVLRAELALATARERQIELRGARQLAAERLATSMGLTAIDSVEPQPLASEPEADAAPAVADIERAALTDRVELRELDRRIEQSSHAVNVAYAKLAPRVDLIGAYQHNEGSEFVQTNAAYVGVFASWDVWDWGATKSGVDVATAHMHQAENARTQLQAAIRMEVREAHVRLQSAAEGMTVAKAAIAQAEENYRLVDKRYAAHVATSFDVVDAEALLTRARGQMQTSTYDYLVAKVALERARGATP